MQPREYSKRLGVIAPEQLQAALDCFGLGRLLGAEPAPGGLFGQNVFLSSTEGEFVLRGAPHYGWVFPNGGQFHKERFYARLIHERTSVPAPWPYLLDESPQIFGWEYAIMPRLPGLQVGDAEVRRGLSDGDKEQVARALGLGLADLHALTWPHLGDYDHENDSVKPDPRPFPERVRASIEDWYERCRRASGATTDADIDWCRSLVAANEDALDVPFQPTIVHHDYKEGNCVLERVADGWRISGVFDLMECYFGDPEEDLPRSVFDYAGRGGGRARDFVTAYARLATLRPGHQERFRIYMLRDCLVMWEYGQRNGVWFDRGQEFQPWAKRFVELDTFASP